MVGGAYTAMYTGGRSLYCPVHWWAELILPCTVLVPCVGLTQPHQNFYPFEDVRSDLNEKTLDIWMFLTSDPVTFYPVTLDPVTSDLYSGPVENHDTLGTGDL